MAYLGTQLVALVGMYDPETPSIVADHDETSYWSETIREIPELLEIAIMMAREAIAADDLHYRRIFYPRQETVPALDESVKIRHDYFHSDDSI